MRFSGAIHGFRHTMLHYIKKAALAGGVLVILNCYVSTVALVSPVSSVKHSKLFLSGEP